MKPKIILIYISIVAGIALSGTPSSKAQPMNQNEKFNYMVTKIGENIFSVTKSNFKYLKDTTNANLSIEFIRNIEGITPSLENLSLGGGYLYKFSNIQEAISTITNKIDHNYLNLVYNLISNIHTQMLLDNAKRVQELHLELLGIMATLKGSFSLSINKRYNYSKVKELKNSIRNLNFNLASYYRNKKNEDKNILYGATNLISYILFEDINLYYSFHLSLQSHIKADTNEYNFFKTLEAFWPCIDEKDNLENRNFDSIFVFLERNSVKFSHIFKGKDTGRIRRTDRYLKALMIKSKELGFNEIYDYLKVERNNIILISDRTRWSEKFVIFFHKFSSNYGTSTNKIFGSILTTLLLILFLFFLQYLIETDPLSYNDLAINYLSFILFLKKDTSTIWQLTILVRYFFISVLFVYFLNASIRHLA